MKEEEREATPLLPGSPSVYGKQIVIQMQIRTLHVGWETLTASRTLLMNYLLYANSFSLSRCVILYVSHAWIPSFIPAK